MKSMNQKIGLMFLFASFITFANLHQAHAEETEDQELATHLSEKLESYLLKLDPYSNVSVHVKLKSANATLPGTNIVAQNIVHMDASGKVSSNAIALISIEIDTSLQAVPKWFEEDIKHKTGYDSVRTEVTVHAISKEKLEEMIALKKSANLDDSKTKESLEKEPKNTPDFFKNTLAIYFAIGSALALYFLGSIKKSGIKVNGGGLSNAGNSERGESAQVFAPASNAPTLEFAPNQVGIPEGENPLVEMNEASILALMSDCYWSSEDAYAHYVWSHVSTSQREAILKSNFVDQSYFSFILGFSPVNLGVANHPSYLNPITSLDFTSQNDLISLLGQLPSAYHSVRPIRQDSLAISLEFRLKLSAISKADSLILKAPRSARREFSVGVHVKQISVEDELFLMKEGKNIDPNLRPGLASLVWFWILPEAERKIAFQNFSAKDLATAWVGPKAILDTLSLDLPPEKFEMLSAYLKAEKGNRASGAFKLLHQFALEKLTELETKKLDGKVDDSVSRAA